MNMDKLNRWLILAANIGVISGVVFLAYELRQNNQILIQESRYSMLQNQKDWAFTVNGDEAISRLIYAVDGNELSELDQMRRIDILGTLFLMWQWEFEQANSDLFGETTLPVDAYRFSWSQLGIDKDWTELKLVLNSDFIQFIEEEVANR